MRNKNLTHNCVEDNKSTNNITITLYVEIRLLYNILLKKCHVRFCNRVFLLVLFSLDFKLATLGFLSFTQSRVTPPPPFPFLPFVTAVDTERTRSEERSNRMSEKFQRAISANQRCIQPQVHTSLGHRGIEREREEEEERT